MDATKNAEIYYTYAKEKVDKFIASYNNAIKSGLADIEFIAMTNTIEEWIKELTMGVRKIEEELEKLKWAATAAKIAAQATQLRAIILGQDLEKVVAAAEGRKRARDNIEEKARNRARRKEIIREKKKARNEGGGSNA